MNDDTLRKTPVNRIRLNAHEFEDMRAGFFPLLAQVGDASLVLIGEATHGTHEFYQMRADFTRQLVEEKGFTIVAVEADWPDAYRVNRYVQGRSEDSTAEDALSDFKRFPAWMWRNTVVRDFLEWLRDYNQGRPAETQAGFYGMDLYSLNASMEAVVQYLDQVDPEAARRARYRYGCFDHFGEDPQSYGYAASFDLTEICQRETLEQLVDLRQKAQDYLRRDGFLAADEFFFAEQNARVAKNAEEYYRSMFGGRAVSWNLRDQHMAQTLDALLDHHKRQGKAPKAVVWAHNSHLGDARATQMGRHGELNVGQLVRQQYGRDALLVGFTTHTGAVTAASDWDGPAERKLVRPSLPGSIEQLFHTTEIERFLLTLENGQQSLSDLGTEMLQRAIGVIYRPETERTSHYFTARLLEQFDAVIHVDETHALEPLDRGIQWDQGEEPPETYPTG